MTDEQNTGLSEIARQNYGTEYHGDPRDEPLETSDRAASLSMEGALDRLHQSEEEQTGSDAPPPPAAASQSEGAPTQSANEALWSTEDVQTLTQFEQETQRYQQDLQAFAQTKASIDLDELEKTNRGEAQATRQQLKAAEDELRQRHDTLVQVRDQLASRVQERQSERLQRQVLDERRKLDEAVPDLDKGALSEYLISAGFTEQDIAHAYDSRLLTMAEKARRYDELMADGVRPHKVPKTRSGGNKRGKKRSQSDTEKMRANLKRTGRMDDALKLLTAQRSKPNA